MKDIHTSVRNIFGSNSRIMKKQINTDTPFKDRDKDGVVDFIDCVPTNKKKTGPIEFISHVASSGARKISKTYKEYKEKEPERRTAKLEKMKYRTEMAKQETEMARARRSTAEAKAATRSASSKHSFFAGMGSSGRASVRGTAYGEGVAYGELPKKSAKRKAKKARKKARKQSRKGKTKVVREIRYV